MAGSLRHPLTRPPGQRHTILGLFYYLVTSAPVVIAALVGPYFFPNAPRAETAHPLAQVDGIAYTEIAASGYSYHLQQQSNVVFFPAYPLLGRMLSSVTGLGGAASLIVLSHFCLAGAFVLMSHYTAERYPGESPRLQHYVLLAMGLWPATFWFRMAYSESLLLFLSLLSMYGMRRNWPHVVIALSIGLATATRAVGVALLPAFALHVWNSSAKDARALIHLGGLLVIGSLGLLDFMAYLQLFFGNALAFADAQHQWVHHPSSWSERIMPLLTLEPFWSPYLASSPTYWRNVGHAPYPLLNYAFLNPLLFAAIGITIVIGRARRRLDAREVLLSLFMLAIPYVALAYDNLMLSQPRFAAVAFPAYMVFGIQLCRLPRWGACVVFGIFAFQLLQFSVLFGAGYGREFKVLF